METFFLSYLNPFILFYCKYWIPIFTYIKHVEPCRYISSANCKRNFDGNSSCDWFIVLLFGRGKTSSCIFGGKEKSWSEDGDWRAIGWTGKLEIISKGEIQTKRFETKKCGKRGKARNKLLCKCQFCAGVNAQNAVFFGIQINPLTRKINKQTHTQTLLAYYRFVWHAIHKLIQNKK